MSTKSLKIKSLKNETVVDDRSKMEIQEILHRMIQVSSTREPARWDVGDNIFLGFLNIKKLDDEISDSSINPGDEPFLKETKPEKPETIEEFKAEHMGDQPGEFDENEFILMYAAELPQFKENDYVLGDAIEAIATLRTGAKAKYSKALKNAKEEHQKLIMDYKSREVSIEESYEKKVETYNRKMDRYVKSKKRFEEKVEKFNSTIKLYFSDHVMDLLREDIKEREYAEAIKKLRVIVFTGDRQEGGYLKSILEQAEYNNGMNLEVFLRVISQVFEMAEICGTAYTNESKLSAILFMIERGDCTYLKRILEQTEFARLGLKETVGHLIHAYKKNCLKLKSQGKIMESAHYSQGDQANKTKPLCEICGKYHAGKHIENYVPANKLKESTVKGAKQGAQVVPKAAQAATVTITAEELAEFEKFKKYFSEENAEQAQARAYLANYLDESD